MLFRENQGKGIDDSSNWLGFSLSANVSDQQNLHYSNHQALDASPSSTYPSPSFFFPPSSSTICFCIDENGNPLSESQGMMQHQSPKLEDFLGSAAPYSCHERDMFLSLDSVYCHQQEDPPFFYLPCKNNDSSVPICEPLMGEGMQRTWPLIEDGGPVAYSELQTLTSPSSQSSCITAAMQMDPMPLEVKKRPPQKEPVHRKSIDTFGQRTSQYRGVTRHRWTGRYEAHLWDNSCKKEGQTRKGRQVYLGGYDTEEKAAISYDLAALKYWGPSTHINFPLEKYGEQLEEMKNMSRQEYVAHLRRKSSGFSRGASIYRGVTRHHQHGRWQARIGRVAGNKDLYLGTFSTQEEAAEAYDVAAIKFRGATAVTNFDITKYDVEKIIASNTLLGGELARRSQAIVATTNADQSVSSSLNSSREGSPDKGGKVASWFRSSQPCIAGAHFQGYDSWNGT